MKPNLRLTHLCAALFLTMTANVAFCQDSEGELVSQWIFSNFNGSEVPNEIDAGWLQLKDSKPPELAEESGVDGLLFMNGECLYGESIDIPVLGGFGTDGGPFSIRMAFVMLERQVGAYGGLFEARIPGQSGFRIVINQQMKLGLELSIGGGEDLGMSGNTKFELGVPYTVEVKFDGETVTMLVNGEYDGDAVLPLPAPYNGPFKIGRASGPDYEFRGVISEVSIVALTP